MKTAVEKLELSLLGIISFDSKELRDKYKERIQQAKEMEKEQIINAYEVGITRGMSYDEDIYHKKNWSSSEQYYKETFKSE